MTADRGVSSPLSYAMVVVITVTLTAGLIVGTDEYVDGQRDRAVQDQLEVLGERLASTLATVDRFNETDARPERAGVTRTFPARIAGTQYRINVTGSAGNHSVVRLSAVDSTASARVTVRNETRVRTGEPVTGGTVRVAYSPATDEIVIRNE